MREMAFLAALWFGAILALSAPYSDTPPPIRDYIRQIWKTLTRSNRSLAAIAVDPKFPEPVDGRWPVYVARDDFSRAQQELVAEMAPGQLGKIDIRPLPSGASGVREEGLLYLPKPYVVPGGRFNEMYGWDSFFIQMGLLHDGETDLAKGMTDNLLYEVREYGKVLNANRTYYLTRSQPPLLSEMVLAVYHRIHDRRWLEDSLPAIEAYYRYWTSEPHLTAETGLSRYFDLGEGPAPEVLASEHDARGRTDYDLIKDYFRTHQDAGHDFSRYYDAANHRLTDLFYKNDRSMRESGFDPTGRFGPFGAGIIDYNPVCLNALLYRMETDTEEILRILGQEEKASTWGQRARERAARVNRLMWNAKDGFYYDYDFTRGHVRKYPFITAFYPLWVGIASHEQADRLVRNLPLFEREGGLMTSTQRSGDQWDAPFGWAPLEWIAVEGLRRYGYQEQADRISRKFLMLMQREFSRYGKIVEKYDVVHERSDVGNMLRYGYHSNEAGFGWSNAVFTALLDELPPAEQRRVLSKR